MSTTAMVVIGLIVLLLVIAGIVLYMRERTQHLRERFGPEYGRAVEEAGGSHDAESQLRARIDRVRKYGLRPLSASERDRFAADWRRVQSRFVDNPRDAATQADNLLGQVMTARGYPAGDFDQRLEDLSVDHAQLVQDYRGAHDVVERHARGEASTEDVRQAMISYRALFDELVGSPAPLRAAS